jgi:hypothetical protein
VLNVVPGAFARYLITNAGMLLQLLLQGFALRNRFVLWVVKPHSLVPRDSYARGIALELRMPCVAKIPIVLVLPPVTVAENSGKHCIFPNPTNQPTHI